jgi:hypothetical protein
MRVLGLALAGSLALMAPNAAHSDSLESNTGQAMTGRKPGAMQVADGHGSNWHPAPGGGGGGSHPCRDRAVLMADGVPMRGREFPPTGSGVPAAAPLIIPSQIGEVPMGGGVIRSRSVLAQLSHFGVNHSFRPC